jgi:hypothetical protein
VKVAVCVEQYDKVGILPSQLESLALLNTAMGVTDAAFIDGTIDGVKRTHGFTRYGSYADFFAAETGDIIVFTPVGGTDIQSVAPTNDSWLVFGPAMGWGNALDNVIVTKATIPGGELNSRDAVPIALWELSKWQVQ